MQTGAVVRVKSKTKTITTRTIALSDYDIWMLLVKAAPQLARSGPIWKAPKLPASITVTVAPKEYLEQDETCVISDKTPVVVTIVEEVESLEDDPVEPNETARAIMADKAAQRRGRKARN
jgi:hypothetical protein